MNVSKQAPLAVAVLIALPLSMGLPPILSFLKSFSPSHGKKSHFLHPFSSLLSPLLLISGDSFYYAQYIFTMQQFQEEEVTIDIPNATVIFPVGFDEQIARVWWGHI